MKHLIFVIIFLSSFTLLFTCSGVTEKNNPGLLPKMQHLYKNYLNVVSYIDPDYFTICHYNKTEYCCRIALNGLACSLMVGTSVIAGSLIKNSTNYLPYCAIPVLLAGSTIPLCRIIQLSKGLSKYKKAPRQTL